MLNIILDNDIVLELLSKSKNDTIHSFIRLQKSPVRFWLPCCSLSLLETQMQSSTHRPLATLLKRKVQWLSSLAAHWHEIPADCPNKIQALMSLDAATLPGTTIIWTNEPDFTSLHPDIEGGDHEFVYAMLAQYENDLSLIDLETQQLNLRPSLEKQIFNVLKHGQYINGAEVQRLEKQLAEYVDVKHCISVTTGSQALLIALLAVDVKAGDEVITSPFNFIAAAEMIALLGAKPVFVDIEPITYTLNPSLLRTAITRQTKAIIASNLFGQCADYYAINKIANQYNLPVIEEASQSFGAKYHEKKSCTLSAIGCTSFYPSQALGAYGNAGACFTNDDELAHLIQQLREHGQEKRYEHQVIGINGHLDTLQASLLLAKLATFPKEIEKRVQIAETYTRLLKQEEQIKTPLIATHNKSVYSQYTIEVNHRDEVQAQLQQRGIPTTVHYPIPLHLQPVFAYLNHAENSFPVAKTVAQRVLSLPMHPYLTEAMQMKIVNALKQLVL
jgi:UDP-2-acetamido-2-deoxy-ribo-hexuluronate aminotransferase